jgi:hypothetical protein
VPGWSHAQASDWSSVAASVCSSTDTVRLFFTVRVDPLAVVTFYRRALQPCKWEERPGHPDAQVEGEYRFQPLDPGRRPSIYLRFAALQQALLRYELAYEPE